MSSSGGTAAAYLWIRKGRDWVLEPFAALLHQLRIPPSAVSLAGVLLAASTYWTLPVRSRWALVGVLGPLLCDALDGALARRARCGSAAGKMVDHLCDAAVFATLLTVAAIHQLVPTGPAVAAAFACTATVALALGVGALEGGPVWRQLPRAGLVAHLPKGFFFLGLVAWLLGWPQALVPSLWATAATALGAALLLALRLVRSWPRSDSTPSPP